MRIHGDNIKTGDLYDAARIARVTIVRASMHNSRSRNHAFDIALRGESRRAPMGGDTSEGMAATWDQWGVFLAHLFSVDNTLTIPKVYENENQFHYKTFDRFSDGWPDDAHGDHKFEYSGIPYQQSCTKCTASSRWQ